jgi:arylmalonate decarboxylase-like protein
MMASTAPIKIGFLGSSAPTSPHHDSFRAFIPKDVEFTFVQEAGEKTSLYDARGKVGALISQARGLIAERGWNGLIISGAPKEALNPGMWEQVSSALEVPVALALRSSVAALKAFDARRILLLTPVDDRLKHMYRDYIAAFGIEAFFPAQTLRAHTDAVKLTAADVQAMTHSAMAQYSDVDAIYFQGALLDPLPILEKMEGEFHLPIIASNPAMLWLALSKLERSYTIQGYGRLLASWPALPSGPF